mmetsp:Transcript_73132/g.110296  ORF Transcript_73132/g.110296 Transcript_73132/m.110296 type:complete len:533 (-) Transcript_73132:70-1668(-)
MAFCAFATQLYDSTKSRYYSNTKKQQVQMASAAMPDQEASNDAPEPIPLLFPCIREEHEFPSTPILTLEEACALASETGRPLVLREDATVSQTIILKKRQHLVIRSIGSSDDNHMDATSNHQTTSKTTTTRKKLRGLVHSLFLLNNASQLTLQNIELHHALESDDHRKIGAAVNLRYKGHLEMKDCAIHSQSGFCCWAVQKTKVTLTDCELNAPTRSAVVCFGQATCHLERCRLPHAGVHAVCARGACRLELVDCAIERSAARAIYAYANASVLLKKCHISHTVHPGKAAIEISAAGCAPANDNSNKQGRRQDDETTTGSSLTMQDCIIANNAGAGICLRGSVVCTMTGTNVLEGNAGGNMLEKELLEDDEEDEGTETGLVRRDAPGTSFRQGDWWCPKCPRYVLLDRQSQCSRCSSTKSAGRILTVQEIHQCNQGITLSKTTTVKWSFDADDKGWVVYDKETSRLLEETYQQRQKYNSTSQDLTDSAESLSIATTNSVVAIGDGRYQVNVSTMEQINVDSHFMRLVRRQVG